MNLLFIIHYYYCYCCCYASGGGEIDGSGTDDSFVVMGVAVVVVMVTTTMVMLIIYRQIQISSKIKQQHTDAPISVRTPTTVPRFLPASMTSSSLWLFCLVPAQMPTPSITI